MPIDNDVTEVALEFVFVTIPPIPRGFHVPDPTVSGVADKVELNEQCV